jgi:Flp pilus assembly protein TadG
MLKPLRDLIGSRSGLAAMEFALLLPVLLTCLAGATDLSLAVITGRRLTVAAQSVAIIASTMAVQTSSLNTLTGLQAWQATTAPFALFPQWLTGAVQPGPYSITLSGVNFASSGSAYTASTQWSVANPSGSIKLRPCGSLAAVPDDSTITETTLPSGVFGPTSILVADVSTVFTPVFTSVFLGNVPMSRSAFVSPRAGNGVQLSSSGPGVTVLCPGTHA